MVICMWSHTCLGSDAMPTAACHPFVSAAQVVQCTNI